MQENNNGPLQVAVIHAADGVRFVAAGTSPSALKRQLAEYVQQRAAQQLFPTDAARVTQALRSGNVDLAIDIYFAGEHQRWDEEQLHVEVAALVPDETAPELR